LISGSLYHADTNQILVQRALLTSNPLERMRGLLGRQQLASDEALLIKPCSSVHTFFMRYPIDLIYLDKHWQVTKIVKNLNPWQMSWCYGAKMVIETLSGFVNESEINYGNKIKWITE
jgi:uncharacterized protein